MSLDQDRANAFLKRLVCTEKALDINKLKKRNVDATQAEQTRKQEEYQARLAHKQRGAQDYAVHSRRHGLNISPPSAHGLVRAEQSVYGREMATRRRQRRQEQYTNSRRQPVGGTGMTHEQLRQHRALGQRVTAALIERFRRTGSYDEE